MTPGVSIESKFALLGGRVSYRELATGAYRWLQNELVVTEAARERMAAWVDSGGLTRTPDLGSLPLYGDHELIPVVTAAFRLVPACVAEVMTGVAILTSGRSSNGWTGAFPPRARVVVLAGSRNDEQIRRTLLHEIAHVWLEPWSSGELLAAADHVGLLARVHDAGMAPEFTTSHRNRETRANNLASLWEQALPSLKGTNDEV